MSYYHINRSDTG